MSEELERGPGPGSLPDPDDVAIPDDPADLEADLWAWRAEQRRLGRQALMASTSPWRLRERIGPFALGGLLLVAFLAALAFTVRPAVVKSLEPSELAATSIPDGQVGGLLPPGVVEIGERTRGAQSIRPATLVLVPEAGTDPALLDAVHLQSQAYGIVTAVVGPPERLPLLSETVAAAAAGTLPVVVDQGSVIADGIGLSPRADTTVVVVGVDGRIHTVLENPGAGVQLQSVLSRAATGADPVALRAS